MFWLDWSGLQWQCAHCMSRNMRTVFWLCVGLLGLCWDTLNAQIIIVPRTKWIQRAQPRRMQAQYMSPRQYMRRLNPTPGQPTPPPQQPPANQTPKRPGDTSARSGSSTASPSPVPPPLPAQTTDPEKERQRKETLAKNAVEFLKKRAEAGSASAQYELGKRYMTGDGVEKDLTLARKWLEASANQGNENAKLKLQELNKLEQPSSPLK